MKLFCLKVLTQLAQSRRKKLINATKSNAQQHSLTFWDEIFVEVGKAFPQVQTERVLIDALSARFVLRPESLDVVVGSNLFGDILTDEASVLAGSMGMLPSASLSETGSGLASNYVLANGGQKPPQQLVRDFLGRPSNSQAFFEDLKR